MAASKDLTVRNLAIEQNGDCAGGFEAGGFVNRLDATSGISWLAGEVDPRGQFEAQPGALYSHRVNGRGELWIQDGTTTNDWHRVYPPGDPS